jgi:hypothetical protein
MITHGATFELAVIMDARNECGLDMSFFVGRKAATSQVRNAEHAP